LGLDVGHSQPACAGIAPMEGYPEDGGPATLPPVDEEEEQLLRNFGENKIMERVQETLRRQLEEQLTRLDEDLREMEQAREGSMVHREETGVQLYSVQQQLAQLQNSLDGTGGAVARLASARAAAEAEAEALQAAFVQRKAALATAEAQVEAFRGELDGILDSTRQVELYAADMEAEVAGNRRAALKAAEATQEKERARLAQDAYIDRMTQAVRRAGDNLATFQAQIDAQRAEGAAAQAAMAEANTEMETIRLEKKALLLQWQSTTLSLRRRDEALSAVAATISSAGIELEAMSAEEGNLRKAVSAAQAVHAKVADMVEREEADLRLAEDQATALQRQWEALEARRADVKATLEATDAESKRAAVETSRLLKVVKDLELQRAAVDRSRFGVEDEINTALNSRITNEKASKAMLKEAQRLLERTHALDTEKAEAENVLAGCRVEALTVSARLAALRDALAGINRDIADKEALASKCEADLRQRQDAIEKKASVLDRLNRKAEKMLAESRAGGAGGGEPTGPLAAEVKALMEELAALRSESERLQRAWITDHTALVGVTTETEVRSTRLRELGSELSLLTQKGMRIDRALGGEQAERKRLEGAVKGIRDDMARINALIAKNGTAKERLAVAAYSTEKAFADTLKDMEREAAAADARVAGVREECARLTEDLVEAERQVLAWEKKIALEKETQEALDPSVGEGELQAMEKEVNRMRLRAEGLKREQDRLLGEMERAVEKRDVIAQKHRSAKAATMAAAAASGKGIVSALGGSTRGLSSAGVVASVGRGKALEGDALTRIGLEARAGALRGELAAKSEALGAAEGRLRELLEEAEAVEAGVGEAEGAVAALQEAVARAQAALRATLLDKARCAEWSAACERILARHLALETGRLPSVGGGGGVGGGAAGARARLREAEAYVASVGSLFEHLQAQHWDLAEAIGRIREVALQPTVANIAAATQAANA
jgi:chromosome segregation ATPase